MSGNQERGNFPEYKPPQPPIPSPNDELADLLYQFADSLSRLERLVRWYARHMRELT